MLAGSVGLAPGVETWLRLLRTRGHRAGAYEHWTKCEALGMHCVRSMCGAVSRATLIPVRGSVMNRYGCTMGTLNAFKAE